MRLAIYAIAKNEAKNISKWMDNLLAELEPGDSITVLDTGSTDGTLGALMAYEDQFPEVKAHSANINPWRFDAARNAALALADPKADAAWSLDLDEFPQPGWRDAIEEGWASRATRLRYKFVWSFLEDGGEGVTFYADKLHARHGFHWKGIAHEWLVSEQAEHHLFVSDLVVHHHQDTSINRLDRDMELMERAIAELPEDERLQHYYARQLFFMGRMVEAANAFQRHLDNPKATWRHERSESMLYLAKTGGNEAWEHQWYYRALAECPERREVWVEAAEFELARGNKGLGVSLLRQALAIPPERYYLSRPGMHDEAINKRISEVLGAG